MPVPPRTILLIDDDELSRAVLGLYLADAGYQVMEAEDGTAALNCVRRHGTAISLVLCDLQMPGLHGPALLAAMRPLLTAGTPVLAISGSQPAPETVATFNGFLLKPPTPGQLGETVDALLREATAPAHDPRSNVTILDQLAATGERTTVLDESAFGPLCAMLRKEQLTELFRLSFSELSKHLVRMEQALHAGDRETMHHSAHTVKGSFAIVGARELQQLAALLEAGTGTFADQTATLAQIPLAADRLRRMLSSREVHLELLPPSVQERS